MKEISREIVENYDHFSHNIFWSPDNSLYKICAFGKNVSQRIEFLKYVSGLENVDGLILPMDLLKDTEIYGYEIPFLSDSVDLDAFLKNPKDDIDKKMIIIRLFQILNDIHKYFIFNDVRNANILIKNNKPYFIDWDSGMYLNSSEIIPSSYNVFKNASKPTLLNDFTKTFMCALSLFFQIDFEFLISYWGLSNLKKFFILANIDKEIINCLSCIILAYEQRQTTINFDFPGMFESINLPSQREIKRIREKINS